MSKIYLLSLTEDTFDISFFNPIRAFHDEEQAEKFKKYYEEESAKYRKESKEKEDAIRNDPKYKGIPLSDISKTDMGARLIELYKELAEKYPFVLAETEEEVYVISEIELV